MSSAADFKHIKEDSTLLFREDGGDVTHLLNGLGAYEKISYYEQLSVQGRLAAVTAVIVLTGFLGWPVVRGWRRFRGGEPPVSSVSRARWIAGAGVAGLILFVVLVFGLGVALASMNRPTLFNRPPEWFKAVFVVPTMGAVATIGGVGYAAQMWVNEDGSLASRVHYSMVVMASIVLYWLLYYWNLLLVRMG